MKRERKVSADRDHAAEPEEVQCHNLEKEEEADPDLEFACKKEAERGHARATDPMHHVHVGQKAKRTYPKVKTTRFKGKGKGKGKGKDSKGDGS